MNNRVCLTIAISSFAVCAQQAFSFPKYLDQFTEHYDANNITTQRLTEEQSCGVCHVRAGGGGRRTPYGEDFKDVVLGSGQGFPAIEFLDSDKDGYVNLEEIYIESSPGSAESTPAGKIELTLTSDTTMKVSPASACSELDLLAFGFSFEGGRSALKLSNISTPTDVSVNGNKGAVLAKCKEENLTGSLLK